MQHLDNLLLVCNLYKQGEYGIEDFQSRILTAAIPENLSKEFVAELTDFDNRLEEIIFCQSPLTAREYAKKVADDLIQATLLEQNRLKTAKPYK